MTRKKATRLRIKNNKSWRLWRWRLKGREVLPGWRLASRSNT